jgi:bifunctional DNA-binding transcriptional regulator/antitoxin component of YhaV-PrlF toxin-antitoxin module
MWTVRLDSLRQLTLPDEVLVAAGLEPGAELRVQVVDKGCMVMETPDYVLKRAKSRIKTVGSGSEVDAFLAERAN